MWSGLCLDVVFDSERSIRLQSDVWTRLRRGAGCLLHMSSIDPSSTTDREVNSLRLLNHRLTTSQLDFISVCEANPVFL